MEKIIDFAHNLFKKNLDENSIVVDMTVGNGNDTLFLCKHFSFVYGFDIQQQAIKNTISLLNKYQLKNYILFKTSHEFVDKVIFKEVDGFIYNLGYLPKGDKQITTTFESTYHSLLSALRLLKVNGIIILVVYSGHSQGKKESEELYLSLKNFNQNQYEIIKYEFINQKNNPPYVLAIQKKF